MPVKKYYQQKMALGCETTLVIVTDNNPENVDVVFKKLWLKIFQFERKFSRFIPASEISIFNANAGGKTPISEEFRGLLITAKKMALLTDELYNPFVLPALQKAGYSRSFISKYKRDETPDFSMRNGAQIQSLEINKDTATIPINTALDMGGIGKGYLADSLARLSELQTVQGFWFSLGGDVVTQGYDDDGKPWRIVLQDASRPSNTLDIQLMTNSKRTAVATSGTIIHRGTNNEQTWHHIIDTRTGKPADTDILLATVEACSTCLADVLAKCAVILGSTEAPRFLKKHKVSSYVFQLQQQNYSEEIIVSGAFDSYVPQKIKGVTV